MMQWLSRVVGVALVGWGCQASPQGAPSVEVAANAPAQAGAESGSGKSKAPPPAAQDQKGLAMVPGKPLFNVRLDIEGCAHDVYVNGGLVTRNLEGTPAHAEYPVNHWLRSGSNLLQVNMLLPEGEPDTCNVKLELRYKDDSAPPDAPALTLATLVHDGTTAPANNPTLGSSPSGSFDSRTGQPATSSADVRVSAATIQPLTPKVPQAHVLSRSVELGLPFPEWAFFRGEVQRPDWDYESKEARQPVYGALLETYQSLHDLLAKGDIDAFVDACEERSREMDIAYYQPSGTSREALRSQVASAIANSKFELESIRKNPGKYWGYLVGPQGTLVALTQGTRASALLSFQRKGEELAIVLPTFFRKEQGK